MAASSVQLARTGVWMACPGAGRLPYPKAARRARNGSGLATVWNGGRFSWMASTQAPALGQHHGGKPAARQNEWHGISCFLPCKARRRRGSPFPCSPIRSAASSPAWPSPRPAYPAMPSVRVLADLSTDGLNEGAGPRGRGCRPGLHPRRDLNGNSPPPAQGRPTRDRKSQYPIINIQFPMSNEWGGAGSGNPISRGDAEGAEIILPGSAPGRGFMNYRTDPITDPIIGFRIVVRAAIWHEPSCRFLCRSSRPSYQIQTHRGGVSLLMPHTS